jgi:hypothetical protein
LMLLSGHPVERSVLSLPTWQLGNWTKLLRDGG